MVMTCKIRKKYHRTRSIKKENTETEVEIYFCFIFKNYIGITVALCYSHITIKQT